MKRITNLLGIIIIAAILISAVATSTFAGEWSASQTVTFEPGTTIYTANFEYEFADWWVADFTYDYHYIYGAAYDVSTTMYIPFDKHIYSTVGIRRPGKERPKEQGLIPYLSVTYRF